jgi:phage protein D
MIREIVTVSVNGARQDDLLADIADIEVEEHVEAADVFRVRLSISVRADGTWRYLDDARLAVWNRLAIRAGYSDDHELLIDGFITHVNATLSGSGAEESFVELTGSDASAVMDLEDRQVAWTNKKDSDIAQDIFGSYGLTWEVEDTEVLHGERVATILQSESDIRFLQRLAARNGFECFVKGNTGHFRTANLEQPPQKPLAVQFGPETNVASLRIETDGTPPSRLEIRRIDPFEKRDERELLGELPERPLGKRSLAAARAGVRDGRRVLRQQPAVSKQELRARLRAGYEAASRFVIAAGEVDGRAYGAVLRARRLVTIKGIGATHSGLYYVTRVRHQLSADAYVQSFEARRNAIGLLGNESFIAPPVRGPIAATSAEPFGNRLLPAQRTGSPSQGGV